MRGHALLGTCRAQILQNGGADLVGFSLSGSVKITTKDLTKGRNGANLGLTGRLQFIQSDVSVLFLCNLIWEFSTTQVLHRKAKFIIVSIWALIVCDSIISSPYQFQLPMHSYQKMPSSDSDSEYFPSVVDPPTVEAACCGCALSRPSMGF